MISLLSDAATLVSAHLSHVAGWLGSHEEFVAVAKELSCVCHSIMVHYVMGMSQGRTLFRGEYLLSLFVSLVTLESSFCRVLLSLSLS